MGLQNGKNSVYWLLIAVVVIISVNLIDANTAFAAGALKYVKISEGKSAKRKLGVSGAIEAGWIWTFENQPYTVLMAIDAKSYNRVRRYKREKPSAFSNYHSFFYPIVRSGTDSLQDLVREFGRIMPNRWSAEKKVNFVLAFVQAIPYTYDNVGTGYNEYVKYAIETLVENEGDCEDTSVLLASILSGLDFDVALIWVPGHIAVGVSGKFRGTSFPFANTHYYYCETTARGLKIGMLPQGLDTSISKIMPISPTPVRPRQVFPKETPPKPMPPKPLTPQESLEQGIELYEQARFNEAIKSLRSALRGLKISELRARTHLYLGCSKRGFGENENLVTDEFQKALRHNPDRSLPSRIGENHPVFKPLIEKARSKSTGRLIVTSSLPHTKIWIAGNEIARKMLGTGKIRLRLFKGKYTVEGIYCGVTLKENVTIEPDEEERLHLKFPLIVKHDAPSKVLSGESIPIEFDLIHHEKPKQVEIRYIYYSQNGNALKRGDEELRLWKKRSASSTWIYQAKLPPHNDVGRVEYFVVADEVRAPESGQYRMEIEEDEEDRGEFIDELKEVEDSWKRIHDATAAAQHQIDGLLNTSKAHIDSADNTSNIHKFNPHQRTASNQLNQATELVKAVAADAPNEKQKLDNLLNAVSEIEANAKANKRLSKSFIETTANSLKDKIKGSKNLLNGLDAIRIRLKKLDSQLAEAVREFNPLHRGLWVGLWSNDVSDDGAGSNRLGLAYMREGKASRVLGAQMDFSYQNVTNTSGTVLWEPDLDINTLAENSMALTFLGGIARYSINSHRAGTMQDPSDESTHTTPIFGAGLKIYPQHRVTVDVTSSFKLRSSDGESSLFDKHLYHYELGVRVYVSHALNLRLGYGQWNLGERNITGLQIGLGALF